MSNRPSTTRLLWPDIVKGIAILWVVFFHGFTEFRIGTYPWPLDAGYWQQMCGTVSGMETIGCALRASLVAVGLVGFHCVGVFIVLSGFGLAMGAARRPGRIDWRAWYRSRLLRLFPLYWVAHLIYLISPPATHLEPIDYRFLLSFLGDRVLPLMEIFFYANAAWWYFGLLLQLYLVFPLLWEGLRRLDSARFLVAVAVVTGISRYLFLVPWASEYSEPLLLGAAFTSRLFEFAVGMAVGRSFATQGEDGEQWLRHPSSLLGGTVLYTLGLYSYDYPLAYIATDALLGCGLTLILCNLALTIESVAMLRAPLARIGVYSYGLYLLHQPYMIWLGSSMRGRSPLLFLIANGALTLLLAAISMLIEERVNRQVDAWVGRS